MTVALVRYHVRDYDAYLAALAAERDKRVEAGSLGAHLYRSMEDPNVVLAVWEFDRPNSLEAYFADPALADQERAMGVTEREQLGVLRDAEDHLPA